MYGMDFNSVFICSAVSCKHKHVQLPDYYQGKGKQNITSKTKE